MPTTPGHRAPAGTDWAGLAGRLTGALHLRVPPVGITWVAGDPPEGVAPLDRPLPEPTPDGRTGRASAGCVFWVDATERTFTTTAQDHGNCSVGSVTHGWATFDEVAGNADVAALLDSGWVTPEAVPRIPVVAERPDAIVYGPLADVPVDPDVVLLRVDGRQLMVLHDALPAMRMEGKPQCHVLALAKAGEPAASVGCQLSRVRTGMANDEMTCALPASGLGEVVERLEATVVADRTVAAYAAEDARRFA